MAEKKNLPEIRFNGFSEQWEANEFSLMVTRISSISGKVGLPRVEYEDIISGKGELNKNIYQKDSSKIGIEFDNGDVLYGKLRPYLKNWLLSSFNGIAVGDFWVLRAIEINSKFIYYLIQTSTYETAANQSTGTKMPRSDWNVVSKTEFFIPKIKKEQSQIGTYFQHLDHLITLQQSKYDKLVNVKKAMLEKMFPKEGADVPEIRFKGFNGAWEERKFGKCVLIQRGGSPRPIENFMTDDENGINWIKIGDVAIGSRYITKTKEKIISEGEKHSRKVQKGDLILSNSMSFGRPYIMAIDGCIHDGWLLIRDEKKMFDLEYLLQLLSSDYMLNQYRALASGGVVINLNSELVQSTNVLIPNKDEQHKIGYFFTHLDHLLTLHQQELEKLKNIKKACLEKMFV